MEELLNTAKNAFPSVSGTEKLNGIKEEVEILWDKWGIPHIYANSIYDAYFAQGYIHAQHRLFQMEQFRRLTTGELSEMTGEGSLDSDKHYKIIGLHRIARACVERLKNDPTNKQLSMLESYVNGVNEGIEKARKNPPIEFGVLELELRDWRMEDSLKISGLLDWGLSGGSHPLELLRAKLISKVGRETANKIIPLFSGANIEKPAGSNGWAVSPKKSTSGAVLLANDPHLPLMLPSIWFLVHINCPESKVIGSSLPGLPSVLVGHNEKIAWGCTNVSADTIDLFDLEINPENVKQYRYNDEWVDFEEIEDPIKMKDKDPIPFTVLMTRFGPVIEYVEHDREIHKINYPGKLALKWISYEGRTEDSLKGFLKINNSSNWAEFREATSYMAMNPQNFIYGDIEGNIGHQHGGKIPIRNYGDGATITPGTNEEYDWKGPAPFEKMFSIYNPNSGLVYTANHNEDKAPNGVLISQESSGVYRQKRLKNLLQSKEKVSLQDFKDFQNDLYSAEAAELLPLMITYVKTITSHKIKPEIISLLDKWDFILTKNSIEASIYKVWSQETIFEILTPIIGKELVDPTYFDLLYLFNIFNEKKEELQALLVKTLKKTIIHLTERFSSDLNKWKWGNLHKLTLTHPFSSVNEDAKALNIGPFKRGGDRNTLNNGYCFPSKDFQVFAGPSFRQIHDLSDWDKSQVALPGGQSGLPFHKHYKDLMKLWVRGKYIPLLFSKEAISKNLEGIMKLVPF